MKEYNKTILKKASKEIILEAFVCIVLRACLLIIPILYSKMISDVSSSLFEQAIHVLIIYIKIF